MAFLIEQNVGRLLVAMNHVRRVQVLGRLQQLIHDVLFVHVFENGLAFDHVVQVGLHVLEHEVNVAVVVRFDYVVQFDDVRVLRELFKEHDFTIGALFGCNKNVHINKNSIKRLDLRNFVFLLEHRFRCETRQIFSLTPRLHLFFCLLLSKRFHTPFVYILFN